MWWIRMPFMLKEIWREFLLPSDISRTSGKVENVNISAYFLVRDVFSWSYEEIPLIDPSIVEHEIKTYSNAKPVQKHLRVVNPRKAPTIKAKVEKLLNVGFIYPVLLT
jgi:hypothetical protein